MADCSADGCSNLAREGGALCWAHLARRTDGNTSTDPLRPYNQDPFDRLEAAALALADARPLKYLEHVALTYASAEQDGDFARARERLRKAAAAYGLHLVRESRKRKKRRARR